MQEKLVVSLTEGQEVEVESQSHQRRKGVVEAVNVSKGAYSDSKEKRLRIKLRIKKSSKSGGSAHGGEGNPSREAEQTEKGKKEIMVVPEAKERIFSEDQRKGENVVNCLREESTGSRNWVYFPW